MLNLFILEDIYNLVNSNNNNNNNNKKKKKKKKKKKLRKLFIKSIIILNKNISIFFSVNLNLD